MRSSLSMKVIRCAFLLLVTFTPSIARSSPLEQPLQCGISALPAAVRVVLNRDFPDRRPKQLSDLSTSYQRLWLAIHGKQCPGLLAGHFESAKNLSYVLLLLSASVVAKDDKLVVFNNDGTTYTWKIVDQFAAGDAPVISKAPPGKHSDWENRESVQLHLDGIQVEWLETAGVLYYWSAGKYLKLQTSD
jgi:hypothetical protein